VPPSARARSVDTNDLAARRLGAQQIVRARFAGVAELVRYLGAVQAQDFAAARWAVGLRVADRSVTDQDVDRAICEGAVIRTHALRWTWQLVAPEDVRWLLALLGPRLAVKAARRHRELGLDAATFRRSGVALARALRGGVTLTRAEMAAALARAGVSPEGQRLSHILGRAELDGVVCSGGRRGKQLTYALLDDRVPASPAPPSRAEALAALAGRYFRSRGPASVADFIWWSGLAAADARAGLDAVRSDLEAEVVDGVTYWRDGAAAGARASGAGARAAHLLPAFDEYLVAYRDRDALIDPMDAKRINAGGGILAPVVVVGGRAIGTWRRTLARAAVAIEIDLFGAPAPRDRPLFEEAARRYGVFLGLDARLVAVRGSR